MRERTGPSADAHRVDAATRDAGNRLQGLRAQIGRLLGTGGGRPDDGVLRARARSRIGRVVSHPHAVRVDAKAGRVTLSGPILAHEQDALLDAARAVPGVEDVENRLEAHETAEGVAALQSGRVADAAPNEAWTPALRIGAVGGGGLVALRGMRRGGLGGLLMTLAGIGLATRGATNVPLARLSGAHGRAIDVQKTIDVAASPRTVFDLWTRYENFPYFMSHVKHVRDIGDGRSHWTVDGPAGTNVEWVSAITRMVAGRLIEWRSGPGSVVAHAGSVRFEPFDGGTRITMRLSHDAGGGIRHGVAALFGRDPEREIDDGLMGMKQFIETGARPRDAGGARQRRRRVGRLARRRIGVLGDADGLAIHAAGGASTRSSRPSSHARMSSTASP